MGTRTLLTTEEYAQMQTSEREVYELVDGELIPVPSALPIHGIVCGNVTGSVVPYLRQNRTGRLLVETDCRIADNTVRRPDVSIYLNDQLQRIDLSKIPIPFPPDIAVEALSPSESAIDINRKIRDYLDSGTKEVWVLDYKNGEVLVHVKLGSRTVALDHTLESPLLPGFAAPVSELLATS